MSFFALVAVLRRKIQASGLLVPVRQTFAESFGLRQGREAVRARKERQLLSVKALIDFSAQGERQQIR